MWNKVTTLKGISSHVLNSTNAGKVYLPYYYEGITANNIIPLLTDINFDINPRGFKLNTAISKSGNNVLVDISSSQIFYDSIVKEDAYSNSGATFVTLTDRTYSISGQCCSVSYNLTATGNTTVAGINAYVYNSTTGALIGSSYTAVSSRDTSKTTYTISNGIVTINAGGASNIRLALRMKTTAGADAGAPNMKPWSGCSFDCRIGAIQSKNFSQLSNFSVTLLIIRG